MYRIDIEGRDALTGEDREALAEARRHCAGGIIRMTYLAGCGHPGGSLSSLDFLSLVYATAELDPKAPRKADRDRVIISHGHISPGAYAVLARYGFIDEREAHLQFRLAGSPYSGHVETGVPGVEWNTGNLGQGLSAGCAAALAARLRGERFRSVVLMGDGEQQKGQVSEARRFATKYQLANLIAFVDLNGLQIGGETAAIMPQDIPADYRAAGWNVFECDGHDAGALYAAWRRAYRAETERPDRPSVIIARTVMGKGISFMEDDAHFHGVAPSAEQARAALAELGLEDDLDALSAARAALGPLLERSEEPHPEVPAIDVGQPRVYGADEKVDCRSGYGNALADLAALNNPEGKPGKVLGLSCDLEGSVRMKGFRKNAPGCFIEAGIQEHHSATLAGRLSFEGFVPFFSTFGVFAVAEAYNQQRLNDINHCNVKVVATHCGLDVGEDGPTHQSIDWMALLSSPFGFKVFSPADANQCDRLIRAIAARPGNDFVAMGRSKVPVIADEKGEPFFAGDYEFVEGKADLVRGGDEATIACFGPTLAPALEARELLARDGKTVAVLNFATLKPLDREAVREAAARGPIVSVEDHAVHCGLGAGIARILGEEGLSCPTRRLGVSFYGSSGKPEALMEEQGMSPEHIRRAVLGFLG